METNLKSTDVSTSPTVLITPDELLDQWQGHRRLTRRVIESFPEDQLYDFSIGGMRSFALLAMEIIGLAAPGIHGIAFGDWAFDKLSVDHQTPPPSTKQGILDLWDSVTEEINKVWPQIPAQRFHETDVAFGQYEGTVYFTLFYLIDNEIHHRAQGYVYLRALGIEPPAFWDRS